MAVLTEIEREDRRFGWMLTAPGLLLLAAVIAFPVVWALFTSLFDYTLIAPGLPQFRRRRRTTRTRFSDAEFRHAAWVTFLFVAAVVALEFTLGFLVALMLNDTERGKNVYYLILLCPLLMNPVVVGLIWRMFLHPTLGIVNYLLRVVGMRPVNWLGDADVAFWTVVMVDIWHQVSFMIVLLLAGLSALPREPYEAARVDGAYAPQALLAHHAAADAAGHRRDAADPRDLRHQDLRPHLHHDARRARHGHRSRQLLHLPPGLREPQPRRGLRHVGHPAHRRRRDDDLPPPLHARAVEGLMASIELRNVSKVYANGVPAVRDVNLSIADGEFLVFLGPSGCGKSTTLRMIAGLETVTSGDILIGGARMNDVDPADRNIAIVFQNYALYPHMSVRDNLAFGLKLRHVPRPEIERRIADFSEMLGIGPLLARRPAQLSGGQRQRVALGRALVREPQAFLLDEPLSNLDAKLRASMRTELIKLHRRLGTTMIHVTHDQVEAMTMGERICIMRDGEVVQVGAPLDVYRRPDRHFRRELPGDPADESPARPSRRRGRQAHGALARDLHARSRSPIAPRFSPYAGRDVIIGVRPEDLHTSADRAGPLAAPLTTVVETVEALGPETVLMLSLPGSKEIAARVDLATRFSVGQTIEVHFDARRLSLFDPATTKRIARVM